MTTSRAIDATIQKIVDQIEDLVDIEKNPAEFIRDIYKEWKTRGGKVSGKPRHSDRYLDQYLQKQGTPVRSLTPKLVGKTNIQPQDGNALIRAFLTHWPEPSEKEGEVKHTPFLSDAEIDVIADYVEKRIEAGATSPTVTPVSEPISQTLPGEDMEALITRFFEESDAIITVSPSHSLVPVQSKTELIGFRNLMNSFMAIERRDKKPRPLIWVFDLGDQIFEDEDSRRKYLNVQSVITRFKALKCFEDRNFEQRWQWLQSRGVIVLLDHVAFLKEEEEEEDTPQRNRIVRPSFQANNITLSSIPSGWVSSAEFRALYGRELEQFDERIFSVFYNASAEWSSPKVFPETADQRYFGYASFTLEKGKTVGRGLELPPLMVRTVNGFQAVAMAAAQALKIHYPPPVDENTTSEIDPIEQLRYLGFRILRLNEFLEEY